MKKEEIEERLAEAIKLNKTMKDAAKTVGYDIDAETKKTDNRIQVNIYQEARIQILKARLKEEYHEKSKCERS